MYFAKETKDGSTVLVKIKWKVHIIKNLKAKLFIKINILDLKLINIYILKKKVYLRTYKIIILIKIHPYRTSI